MKDKRVAVLTKSKGEPFLVERGDDYFEYQLPISVKGALLNAGRVLLVGNTRGELELPGGKLEVGETPEECVAREIEEETGLSVVVEDLLLAWVYQISQERHVFVLAYGVKMKDGVQGETLTASSEVGSAHWIPVETLKGVNMPTEYRIAIGKWWAGSQTS